MATLNEPLYGQRLHPRSLTYSAGTQYHNQLPRTLAAARSQQKSDGSEIIDDVSNEAQLRKDLPVPVGARRWRLRWLWILASMCFEIGDYRGGREFIREAWTLAEPNPYYLLTAAKAIFQIILHAVRRAVVGQPESGKVARKYGLFGEASNS